MFAVLFRRLRAELPGAKLNVNAADRRLPRPGLLCALCLAASLGSVARAELTPESPEVKKAVERGLAFLATTQHDALGGKALIGLACYKATNNADDPVAQKQLKAVVEQIAATQTTLNTHNNYSVGIAIIFLATVDPQGSRESLNILLAELLKRQKGHGGWGYTERPTGDTSMTQYAVLGMWEASRAGLDTPVAAWEKVANWLLRTQDPSGGFGYQGNDPGGGALVPQQEVRHSLTAGGLASVLVCADQLGLADASDQPEEGVPSALSRVDKQQPKIAPRPRRSNNVNTSRLRDALSMGRDWFIKNWSLSAPASVHYFHYFLYALERYEAFRDALGGPPEDQDWYTQGAESLLKSQHESGAWYGQTGAATDTAFSILFLVRSTQKALAPRLLGAGSMVGGRGIPKAQGPLRMQGGDIVATPLKASTDRLLTVMENANDPASLEAAEGFYEIAGKADPETLSKHTEQFKKLAANERPESRVAAVRALGRVRNLDDVPVLLFALTDPDTRVVSAAVDALRYVSRQPAGTPGTVITDEASRDAALVYWKQWYRRLRPDADLSGIDAP